MFNYKNSIWDYRENESQGLCNTTLEELYWLLLEESIGGEKSIQQASLSILSDVSDSYLEKGLYLEHLNLNSAFSGDDSRPTDVLTAFMVVKELYTNIQILDSAFPIFQYVHRTGFFCVPSWSSFIC